MTEELIARVEILDGGELALVLESDGKPGYQLIYREAAEVSWDNALKAFKSPAPRKWSHADWYSHIIAVAKICDITLKRTENTEWVNVPSQVMEEIRATGT